MANIQDLLDDILEAKYGEEVRGSIHDAIEQCYQDGQMAATDLVARNGVTSVEIKVGDLTTLTTDVKTDIVSAINEVDDSVAKHDIHNASGESLELDTGKGGIKANKVIGKSVKNDDEIFSSGSYGCVDLGSLNYQYNSVTSSYPYGFFVCNDNIGANGANTKFICPKYEKGYVKIDKSMYFNNNNFVIVDSAYTDATTFKTAMSGVLLAYEVADGATPSGYAEVVEEHNNNLLTPSLNTETTVSGVTCTPLEDGTFKLSGIASGNITSFTFKSSMFLPKGTYKFLGCPSGGSGSTYRMVINGADGKGAVGNANYDIGNGNVFTITEDRTITIYPIILSGTVCNNLIFKPMITTDTTAIYNDFVKAESNVSIIPLSAPLRSVGDVKDEIDVENGQIIRRVGYANLSTLTWTFNGSTAWYSNTLTDGEFKYNDVTWDSDKWNPHTCSGKTEGDIVFDGDKKMFVLSSDSSNSPDGCIVYKLATQTVESLSTEQIKALHSIVSYDGKTYIDSADDYAKATLDVDYGKSRTSSLALENYNSNVIDKLSTSIGLATTTNAGLMPRLDGSSSKFLAGDGTWKTVESGGGSSGITKTLLWTNSSPTANFAAQTVSLSLSSYKKVLIKFKSCVNATEGNNPAVITSFYYYTDEVWVGENSFKMIGANYPYARLSRSSSTGIVFNNTAILINGIFTEATSYNSICIPYEIYGIK